MAYNFFEDFREKKGRLVSLTDKALDFGWIDHERANDIKAKLDADTLTIGVIGQMKCGKSTFLNAFVFENDILPSATTPMTAALSIITYGEKAKVVAEFYTKDEWLEQCVLATQSLDGLSEFEESKVKAAKELVGKSAPIKDSIEELLGKTQEDELDRIVDYVGADGKYVSITKAVKIYYPEEYLKGVEIVDTPGFNDPIVSRELRTKEFLKNADVVVMMLYAGRPFDSTDRTILFENVKQCGIGKVIIGVNKYDIPYEKGESPDKISQYVIEQIKEESRKCHDETMLDILKNADPILLSAEMALLSVLPMSRIVENDAYDHAYKRYASELEVTGALKLREMSHIDNLANAIKSMVEQDKYDILLKKPINSILAAGSQKKDDILSAIAKNDAEIKILGTPDDEMEEKELNLSKASRRLSRKVDGLGDDLNLVISEIARKGRNDIEDAMDACCKKMEHVVDSVGVFGKFDSIKPRLDQLADEFETRTSKRLVEQLAEKMKNKLKTTTSDFLAEAEDIISRFVPDVDSREFVKEIERQINLQIEDESIFSHSGGTDEKSNGVWGQVLNGGVAFAFGLIGLGAKAAFTYAFRGLNHDKSKTELLEQINKARTEFDAKPYIDTILISKDNVVNLIKQKFFDELIAPLSNEVAECRTSRSDREAKLESAKNRQDELIESRSKVEQQINEIQSLMVSV